METLLANEFTVKTNEGALLSNEVDLLLGNTREYDEPYNYRDALHINKKSVAMNPFKAVIVG